MANQHTKKRDAQREFCTKIREDWDSAITLEDYRKDCMDDIDFGVKGNQWPEQYKTSRELAGRPCLVVNRIPQFVAIITNDQRQSRPAIQVDPVDSGADVETASIYQGLVRHIEYQSNADIAYDTAFEFQVTGGLGYIRVVTDYVDDQSFNQDIFIRPVNNPFMVVLDPLHQMIDGSDANWGMVASDISKEEYKERYPNSKLAEAGSWADLTGGEDSSWLSENSVRLVEVFRRERDKSELVLLDDNTQFDIKDLPKDFPQERIVRRKEYFKSKIMWYLVNGNDEILEETEWPGKYIPIVPVYGRRMFIGGRPYVSGIVRNARDSQRMYNYWVSAETEAIALAPKAPWVGPKGFMEGNEEKWLAANTDAVTALEYEPVMVAGQIMPPPQRNSVEPAVMAITNARRLAEDDLKATTGIYDAALGARSNEQTGRAIIARQQQGQLANFHLIDNLNKAIRQVGRIVVDLIPRVYDTVRTERIIGDDGTPKQVQLNGAEGINLNNGRYDVTIRTGPSFNTQRQESVQAMLQLVQSFPPLMQIAGDQLLKNMDWPGAKEISKRFEAVILPEELREGKMDPAMAQAVAKRDQMIKQLSAELTKATSETAMKTMELESKERIAYYQAQVDLVKIAAQNESKEAIAGLQLLMAEMQAKLAQLPPTPDTESAGEMGEGMAPQGTPFDSGLQQWPLTNIPVAPGPLLGGSEGPATDTGA